MNVSTLRQQLMAGDTVHNIIDHGGDASNIIPAYTRSTWGIRASSKERLDELIPKVRACWEAAATATGCRIEVADQDYPYLNMANNPIMTGLFKANSESLGRPMPTEEEVGGPAAVLQTWATSAKSYRPFIRWLESSPMVRSTIKRSSHRRPSRRRAIRQSATEPWRWPTRSSTWPTRTFGEIYSHS